MSEPRRASGGELTLLALVGGVTFALTTAVTMIGPLLLDLSRDLDVPLGQAGLLAAAQGLPWALGAPFTGLLSDRLGRRPLIILALGGMGAAALLSALAPNYAALFAVRLLGGLFGAFGPASVMAAVGDVFPPARRGMAMGWLSTGFSLATVLGTPLVGAIGGLFGWRWAFAATGLLLLGTGLLVCLAFPATRSAGGGDLGPWATYRVLGGLPGLRGVLGGNLVERTVYHGATVYVAPFLMLSYSLTAVEVAPSLALIAVGTTLGNLIGGWLGDRCPRALVFCCAQLATGAVGLVLFNLTVGLVVATGVGALFGLVGATSRPSILALGAELSSTHRGAVLGLLSLTNQGGVVLGSTLGGLAVGALGYPGLGWLLAGGGALAAACLWPLVRAPHPRIEASR